MTRLYSIRVSGRVQGVWYRAGAQHKAQELGITGFARNETDGTVYLEVEGPEEALKKFVDWCWQGTMAAKVEQVDWEERDPQGYEQFTVA